MKTDQETREIRQLLAACAPGKRHSRAVRDRVGGWIRAQRRTGVALADLATKLGLSTQTLRRWAAQAPAKPAMKLREVAVVDTTSTVSVVSPAGYRVDGLSLRDAAALLRELA